MRKILLNNGLNDYVLPIYIDASISANQVVLDPNHGIENAEQIDALEELLSRLESNSVTTNSNKYITNTKIISTYEDVIEHFKPQSDKYFVTGTTTSKYSILNNYFSKMRANNLTPKKVSISNASKYSINKLTDLRVGVRIKIPSLDIWAMILNESSNNYREYVLYLDTENPIKYIDYGSNLTKFTYLRSHESYETAGNMVYFNNIIDEPKISLQLFIDRGQISAFDGLKKLKIVKSLNDLNKVNLNYFKVNKRGYNFKNL